MLKASKKSDRRKMANLIEDQLEKYKWKCEVSTGIGRDVWIEATKKKKDTKIRFSLEIDPDSKVPYTVCWNVDGPYQFNKKFNYPVQRKINAFFYSFDVVLSYINNKLIIEDNTNILEDKENVKIEHL